MIQKGEKELVAMYIGSKAISYVYRGAKLIWQAISSCFGIGYWKNDASWNNNDAWKN